MNKFLIAFLITILGLIFLIFFKIRFLSYKHEKVDTNKAVYITKNGDNFKLIRNSKEFKIKGVAGNKYLKELSEIGGNTIRVYDTINLGKILDSAKVYDLGVIVDVYVPRFSKEGTFYTSEKNCDQLYKDTKRTINRYKNHPALLLWNLGNEINYPFVLFENNFIKTYNKLIDLIHTIDPNHPVSTSIIRKREIFSIIYHSPKLDLFGFNIFGNLKNLDYDKKKAYKIIGLFPYYLSEYSYNGPWEAPLTIWKAPIEECTVKRSEQYAYQYESFIKHDNQSLGSLFFYWGEKLERTHTWFGVFDNKGRKSEVYYAIQSAWNNSSNSKTNLPQIQNVEIDGIDMDSILVYEPNRLKSAKVYLNKKIDATDVLEWNIYKEKWDKKDSIIFTNKPLNDIKIIPTLEKDVFTFKTPLKDGPYRLFVKVYDTIGNFSSSNIPFYVLSNNEQLK